MKKVTKELKDKAVGELLKEAENLRREIARMKLEAIANPQKDTNTVVKKKKRLAVILTVISEKKALESLKQNKV